MRIYIKNMVCPRCIQAVRTILVSEGFAVHEVNLGDATIDASPSSASMISLAKALEEAGFELLDDPRSQQVEQIRIRVMEWVRLKGDSRTKLSDYLCKLLAKDYSSLSKLFSEVRGMTIERYAILHRVEYAKELLCYSQLSASEIAYALGYSSPAHMSAQFKQITGMTPKAFRQQTHHDRIPLDRI